MKQCQPGKDRRTVRLDRGAGEQVFYRVTVTGARGVFSVVDQKSRVILVPDQSNPVAVYTRTWPLAGDVVDVKLHIHTFAMSFFQATRYDLLIEHRDAAGNVLQVLKDCAFSSDDPTDWDLEAFKIFV